MPKFTKCWFKDCDSDNREESKLLFYKFPKDLERCEQWVNNCSNPELTKIWEFDPVKVGPLRICQKHFLKEFLGSSCRLVGHAVPAPYGIPIECLDTEKFMVECASLKNTSKINARKQRCQPLQQSQEQLMPSDAYCLPTMPMSTNQTDNYLQLTTSISNVNQYDKPSSGLLMTVDQSDYHQQLVDNTPVDNCDNGSNNLYSSEPTTQYITTTYQQPHQHIQPQEQPTSHNMHIIDGGNYSYVLPGHQQTTVNPPDTSYQQAHKQILEATSNLIVPSISSGTSNTQRARHKGNPKINYDRDGKVVSIQYEAETLSMLKADESDHKDTVINALKLKVHHYQRRLAVTNHRYQKLKAQQKGRSHKTRLLEHLKICRKEFEPCVYEIFRRQIKGPTSKHGNRWSNDVKSFASSIYTRSHAAYKCLRKTIDLPSESIVKNFIASKKRSKTTQNDEPTNVDSEDDTEDDNDRGDNCDDGENDIDNISEVDEPPNDGLNYVDNAEKSGDNNCFAAGDGGSPPLQGANWTLL